MMFRLFSRHRSYALAVVASTALGVGTATAVLGFVRAPVASPLPWTHGNEALVAYSAAPEFPGGRIWGVNGADFGALWNQRDQFAAVGAYATENTTLRRPGQSLNVTAARMTAGAADAIGLRARLGRVFPASLDSEETSPEVILSYRFWNTEFGADTGILGNAVNIGGRMGTIVGVLDNASTFPEDADVWVHAMPKTLGASDQSVKVLLLPKSGDSRTVVAAKVASALRVRTPKRGTVTSHVRFAPYREYLATQHKNGAFLLLSIGIGVVLITVVNLAALILARGLGRRGELATRAALGASRWQLGGTLLGEAVALATLGGFMGACLAPYLLHGIGALVTGLVPPWLVGLTWTQLLWGPALGVIIALFAGIGPMQELWNVSLNGVLGETAVGVSGDRRHGRSQRILIAAQVGLATGALVVSGAFFGSWMRSVPDMGVSLSRLLVGNIDSVSTTGNAPGSFGTSAFENSALSIPGVMSAGVLQPLRLPAGSMNISFTQRTAERTGASNAVSSAPRLASGVWWGQMSRGFLRTAGLQPTVGRLATDSEIAAGSPVAVITSSVVPDNADKVVGASLALRSYDGHTYTYTVIGVVPDFRWVAYYPDAQPLVLTGPVVPGRMAFMPQPIAWIRVSDKPNAETLKRVGTAVGRNVNDALITDLDWASAVAARQTSQRSGMARLGLLAFAMGLLLASMGIYGVVAFVSSTRRRELEIRLALGAGFASLTYLITRRAIASAAAGIAVGIFGAAMVARVAGIDNFWGSSVFVSGAIEATVLCGLVVWLAAWGPVARLWRAQATQLMHDSM